MDSFPCVQGMLTTESSKSLVSHAHRFRPHQRGTYVVCTLRVIPIGGICLVYFFRVILTTRQVLRYESENAEASDIYFFFSPFFMDLTRENVVYNLNSICSVDYGYTYALRIDSLSRTCRYIAILQQKLEPGLDL